MFSTMTQKCAYLKVHEGLQSIQVGEHINPRPAGPLDFPPPAGGGGRLNAPPPP